VVKKIFYFCCVLIICYNKIFAQQFISLSPKETNIDFVNYLLETKEINTFTFEYLYNGGGVAVGDINNDGLSDLYFTGNMVPDKLYLNLGNMKFQDITKQANVGGGLGYKTGVTMADINSDGWIDIYVCKSVLAMAQYRANLLYINNKNGTFTESAVAYGLADSSYSTQAYFRDMDLDGDLDMFALNYPALRGETQDIKLTISKGGKLEVAKEKLVPYQSDRFFENVNGKFIDKTIKAGVVDLSFGLSAILEDFNDDNYPDIYVCNDFAHPDALFINNKNGTYTNKINDYFNHTAFNSMGSDYADINNDGMSDLLVMDMLPEDNRRQKQLRHNQNYDTYEKMVKYNYGAQMVRNVVQLNNGKSKKYSDVAHLTGMAFTDWSWAPLIADFDNDGNKDVFITNGYLRDLTDLDYAKFDSDSLHKAISKVTSNEQAMQILSKIPSTKIPNYYYKNKGNLEFENKSYESGFTAATWSNGAAYADLDNDGDLDIIINNLNDYASIYKNRTSEKVNKNNWIRFSFVGNKMVNTYGVKIQINTKDGITQYQSFMPNKGYISCHEQFIHFGINTNTICDAIITWPNGAVQKLNNISANQLLQIKITDATKTEINNSFNKPTLFSDITASTKINHTSFENEYIDFKQEPLLPKRYSQLGPCAAVADFDKDGLEDFFIGGAVNFVAKLYLQNKDGSFSVIANPAFQQDISFEDVGAANMDIDADGDEDLIVISGGNDYPNQLEKYPVRVYINNGKGVFTKDTKQILPKINLSGKSIAIADYDKDGKQDIFIGGRTVPGHYGLIPESYLLLRKGEKFEIENKWKAGMVTDAKWIDLDNDTWLDLVLVGEWMPISIYKNVKGVLDKQVTIISNSNGWWNCISTTDINKDGLPELVLGNLGINSRYKATSEEPLSMLVNDFDNNGSTDCIISGFNKGISYPLATRENLLDQMVYLRKKFIRNSQYATATIKDIFSPDQINSSQTFFSNTMQSCIAINKGNFTFTMQNLPLEAQVFPVQAIQVVDLNKDGFDDLLLVGNDYSAELETGINDAGIGLCLIGSKNGSFATDAAFDCYIPGDTRIINQIKIDGKWAYLVGKNQDKAQLIQAK
jgi:enediyne biosynthesis protein E4